MEFNQLYQFKRIAETGNMSQAAHQLFVSQPALSQNLAKLEKELGVQLFFRKKNRLELNEYGQKVLHHVNIILDEINNIRYISRQSNATLDHLRLASAEDPSLRYFGATINGSFPNLSLETTIIKDSDALAYLQRNQTDIVFTCQPIKKNEIFTTYICETKTYISTPPGHPFYNRHFLNWSDLDGQTFLMPQGLSYLFNRIEAIEKEQNVHIYKLYQRDFALYRSLISSTPYLFFLSTLNHLFPEDNRRKNIPIIDPAVGVHYYASCMEYKISTLLPYITCIQSFYWPYETFEGHMDE